MLLRRAVLALGALLALSDAGQGADKLPFAVVVNTESKLARISDDELLRIFLGKKTLWEETSTRIQPALLEEELPVAQAFLESTLKKSVSQYRAYWKRLLFSGGGSAPRTFRSSAQVIDFVTRQPGAIGVVESTAADARVRVLVLDVAN
jgi:ABC-type phosphate transport system substrate-binding protein